MRDPLQFDEELKCATPETHDEYALYFNHLCEVFSTLLTCYPTGKDISYETESVRSYLIKMLYSIQTLRKKHTYNPAHSLKVDLTDSGFPQYMEFSYFGSDLRSRQQRLTELPPASMLKQGMLEHMFRYHQDPEELLWQMSEREYYEMLDPQKLFLPFTPGGFELRGECDYFRSYIFSWACYDFESNRPYIHLMTFDQDGSAEPLHHKGAEYRKFMEVIHAEGSRVPEVGILAIAIDSAIESVHPKVLKRICIGPLHSPLCCTGEDELCHVLADHGQPGQDFILCMKDEIAFSEGQAKLEAGYFSPRRVREIFHIPETDLDCYEAKASVIHRYMLLPHKVLQHVESPEFFSKYANYRKLTFDTEGQVHGV